MIPLNHQVCALEYSKRLKELGCPQESLWWWKWIEKEGHPFYPNDPKNIPHLDRQTDPSTLAGSYIRQGVLGECSAYTTSELLNRLPLGIDENEQDILVIKRWANGCSVTYQEYGDKRYVGGTQQLLKGDTLPNTLAQMLIYLLENNLMKVPK